MGFMTMIYLGEIICLVYILFKIHSIKYIKNINNKIISWIIPSIIVFAIFGLSFINVAIFTVILAHFVLFMGIGDIIFLFINRNRENKIWKYNIYTVSFTFIYLGVSLFFGLKVFKTTYDIKTDKVNSGLRIVQISDSHIGSTFDGEGLYNYIIDIAKNDIDLFVITGDFVDDDTKYDDLKKACSAFSEIKTTYGVYFVFGNHDKGYYSYRDFNTDELKNELIKNNVKILEDEYVEIGNDYYLIGRCDRSNKKRLSMDKLVLGLDDNRYRILLDHQPNDFDNEKNYVDLVLSGHTHGGNIFPANFIISMLNDKLYGMKVIDNTTFIVSSGISDWRLPFNSCAIQEYVIVNINK